MARTALRVSRVAERLDVSVSTVRRLIRRGDLEGVKIGHQLRVFEQDLEAYLDERSAAANH